MSKLLPHGWRRVRLGEVLERVNRFEKLKPDQEYRLLGVKWYAQGVFERERKLGRAIAAKQLNRVEEGDFVYNRLFAWKGSFAVVGNGDAGGYVSGEFPVFRAKPDAILAEFLYRHFSRPLVWRLIEHHSTGTTNVSRNRWREEQFLSWHISLPPLYQQKESVAILRAVANATKANDEVIGRTRELKSALAHELLMRGVPGQHKRFRDSPVGRIPAGWHVRSLSQCGTWRSGGTPSKANPAFWNGEIPWASAKDFKVSYLYDTRDHIAREAVHSGVRVVPPKTVLVVVRGMILAHTLPVAITERPMSFNQDVKAIECSAELVPEFLLYVLGQKAPNILEKCTTATHGTRRLPQQALEETLIAVPQIEEQLQIARILSALEQYGQQLRLGNLQWHKLAEALCASLLSGRQRK